MASTSAPLLIDRALNQIAQDGVRSLSLRKLTASVELSTGAVFQTFAGREALLCSVLEEAVRRDQVWHHQWATALTGLQPDAEALADLVTEYILDRARTKSPGGAVVRDAMIEHGDWPSGSAAPISAGRKLQCAFWQERLTDNANAAPLAEMIVTYAIMESAFASILHQDIEYRLVLRATTAALVARAMGSTPGNAAAMEWASTSSRPAELIEPGSPTAKRLLEVAAAAIRREGVAALNLRHIATMAKASSSAIAYHFGDLESFSDRAIEWALTGDVPPTLRPWTKSPRKDKKETAKSLADMLEPADETPYRGFYIGYARTVAQTCLLARHRPGLARLVRQSRLSEGAGIFHASHDSWPREWRLTRSGSAAFAIWIKGAALERVALPDTGGADRNAASIISRTIEHIC